MSFDKSTLSYFLPMNQSRISDSKANGHGERNLAPYSYFGAMCHDPPHVTIGICRSRVKPGGRKDTLANILATKGERKRTNRLLPSASADLPVNLDILAHV
eukprot:scaffold128719_cov19-Prasinocladus_malaysianus.AAC.1